MPPAPCVANVGYARGIGGLTPGAFHAKVPRMRWALFLLCFALGLAGRRVAADEAPALGGDGRATNLVANGGFEEADPGDPRRPFRWELPDGLGVRWEEAPDGEGRAIALDTSIPEVDMVESWRRAGLSDSWDIPDPAGNAIAETYGLSYYSDAFPVVSGQTYRVSCRVRGGSSAKVWVRGYGMFRGTMRRRYEAVMSVSPAPEEWRSASLVFHPTRARPDVAEVRVMLYAYYPPAVTWFDDVRVEPFDESSGGDAGPVAQ